jgi:hypothetical protein
MTAGRVNARLASSLVSLASPLAACAGAGAATGASALPAPAVVLPTGFVTAGAGASSMGTRHNPGIVEAHKRTNFFLVFVQLLPMAALLYVLYTTVGGSKSFNPLGGADITDDVTVIPTTRFDDVKGCDEAKSSYPPYHVLSVACIAYGAFLLGCAAVRGAFRLPLPAAAAVLGGMLGCRVALAAGWPRV